MTQFWSPLRELTPSLRRGEWLMADKSRRIGYIREEPTRFVCTTPETDPAHRVTLGTAPTLATAAKRLWEWGRSAPPGWRPADAAVELEPGIWAIPPRPGHDYARGYIEREATAEAVTFTANTWGLPGRPTRRIGVYATLDAAAVAVWENPDTL